jgi:hypothetical protein
MLRARCPQKGEPVKKIIIILVVSVAIIGCNAKQQPVAQTSAVHTSAAVPSRGVPLRATPPAPRDAGQGQAGLLTGKVDETMNAGGYTYVRVGDKWAAVRETKLKKGQTVTIATQMVAENFESKTLGRKFDRIIFGALATDAATAAPQQQPAAPMASAMGTPSQHMNPAVNAGDVHVDKAEGGVTVAEVWSGKSGLQDKPVVVRGKVVKFLPEIMGKNWLHLRDGSGSREKGDDDITVTTSDSVKVGDVVTVKGMLRVDKDFGAGYRYPVIVEDAKLQKQ